MLGGEADRTLGCSLHMGVPVAVLHYRLVWGGGRGGALFCFASNVIISSARASS